MNVNIKNYQDFRLFLLDFVSQQKIAQKGFNASRFSKMLDISPALFKMVVKGERNLSRSVMVKISSILNFSFEEKEYFENLVMYNQAKDDREKNYYFSKINTQNLQTTTEQLNTSMNELIAKWYFPPLVLYIKSVLKINDPVFNEELYAKLKKKFPITAHDFEHLAQLFANPQVRTIGHDGKVHLQFANFGKKIAKQQYLKNLMEANIKLVPISYNRACSFTVSESEYQNLIRDFESLLNQYIAKDFIEGEKVMVVQSMFQMTPFVNNES